MIFTRSLRTITGIFSLSCGSTLLAGSTGLNISAAQDFNLLTWSNGSMESGDSEGRMAIGGNLNLGSYSIGANPYFQVGDPLKITDPAIAGLIVGGNLTWSGGTVAQGSVKVGGSISGPSTYTLNTAAGTSTQSNLGTGVGFDFAGAKASLTTSSNTYAGWSSTGTSLRLGSVMTLTGTDSKLNIFNFAGNEWMDFTQLTINVPAGAQVLINISGTQVSIPSGVINGTYSSSKKILFNFSETQSLRFEGVAFEGSILAPLADVNFVSGGMNGQLIANSFTGVGELHNFVFASEIPPIPEPGTYGLMGGLLLGGLGLARKRFRKRAASV